MALFANHFTLEEYKKLHKTFPEILRYFSEIVIWHLQLWEELDVEKIEMN